MLVESEEGRSLNSTHLVSWLMIYQNGTNATETSCRTLEHVLLSGFPREFRPSLALSDEVIVWLRRNGSKVWWFHRPQGEEWRPCEHMGIEWGLCMHIELTPSTSFFFADFCPASSLLILRKKQPWHSSLWCRCVQRLDFVEPNRVELVLTVASVECLQQRLQNLILRSHGFYQSFVNSVWCGDACFAAGCISWIFQKGGGLLGFLSFSLHQLNMPSWSERRYSNVCFRQAHLSG